MLIEYLHGLCYYKIDFVVENIKLSDYVLKIKGFERYICSTNGSNYFLLKRKCCIFFRIFFLFLCDNVTFNESVLKNKLLLISCLLLFIK